MAQRNYFLLRKKWFVSSRSENINDYYSFQQELGSGGYGKVMQATEKSSGIVRAVKIVQKNRVKDYEGFQTEVMILSELVNDIQDHPNIVNILESFETDRLCYLVMDLCTGGELYEKISKNKHMSEADAAKVMRDLFSAISYCHTNGVCHRDIKPENCLFPSDDPNSDVKLIDFGLAKKFTEEEVMHSLNGTPYYIAPEVLTGNYTFVVDCWSLGVLMYILLSGTPPFNGKNNQEILMSVYNGFFTFKPRAFRTVSEGAKDLISRLLVKEPELRMTASQAIEHP